MSKNRKIAYGCFVLVAFALITGVSNGKIISAVVGGIPFLLIGLYFLKKNSNFRSKNKFVLNNWESWSSKIHNQEKQLRKQQRALDIRPDKLDADNSVAEFVSTTTGEVYDVTLTSCTCESFKRDNTPCKHMYSLAYSLGVMTPKVTKIVKSYEQEEKEIFMLEFSKLDREMKRKIAYGHFSSDVWSFVDKEEGDILLSTGLLYSTDDLSIILPKLTKQDITKVLDNYNIPYEKNAKKQTLIDVCLENKNTVYNDLKNISPVPVKLDKKAERYLSSFQGKYANQYAGY